MATDGHDAVATQAKNLRNVITLWWTNIAIYSHGKSPFYSWENPLCLWPCSIAMLVYQRVFHGLELCQKIHGQQKYDLCFGQVSDRFPAARALSWPWPSPARRSGRCENTTFCRSKFEKKSSKIWWGFLGIFFWMIWGTPWGTPYFRTPPY